MNADDRLSLDPLGPVEGSDGIVEGSRVADVCPQPTNPDPLDEFTHDRQGEAARSVCDGSCADAECRILPICKGGARILEIRQENARVHGRSGGDGALMDVSGRQPIA